MVVMWRGGGHGAGGWRAAWGWDAGAWGDCVTQVKATVHVVFVSTTGARGRGVVRAAAVRLNACYSVFPVREAVAAHYRVPMPIATAMSRTCGLGSWAPARSSPDSRGPYVPPSRWLRYWCTAVVYGCGGVRRATAPCMGHAVQPPAARLKSCMVKPTHHPTHLTAGWRAVSSTSPRTTGGSTTPCWAWG